MNILFIVIVKILVKNMIIDLAPSLALIVESKKFEYIVQSFSNTCMTTHRLNICV